MDSIVTALGEKEDMDVFASTIEKLADEKGGGFTLLKRDTANLRNVGTEVLIGLKPEGLQV